ncbi:hypothetical protein CORAM0001_0231 [Corynebacterium amycolatum SK46]|nr:hypothetical protein CORAM0001_0231 [Corynebacterium amycolatum SK46]
MTWVIAGVSVGVSDSVGVVDSSVGFGEVEDLVFAEELTERFETSGLAGSSSPHPASAKVIIAPAAIVAINLFIRMVS